MVERCVCGAMVERCYWQGTAAACVENLPQCHSANQKSHNYWPVLNPGLLLNSRALILQIRDTGLLGLSDSWHRPVGCVKSQLMYQMLWLTFLMVLQRWQQPNSETILTKVTSQPSFTVTCRPHTQLYGTASFVYLTFSQFGRTALNAGRTTSSKQMCNCQLQTHVYVCTCLMFMDPCIVI